MNDVCFSSVGEFIVITLIAVLVSIMIYIIITDTNAEEKDEK